MKAIIRLIRNLGFKILACIITFLITIYFMIAKICSIFFPIFIPSAFLYEITQKLIVCQAKSQQKGLVKAYQILQIIINSMLSLIFILFIANYSGMVIRVIQTISRQVHQKFISLIFTNFPQMSSYLPYQFISKLYIITGYLGLSVQLAITIDFIRLFNLPTILIYKALAIVYKYLLKGMKFNLNIIKHDIEYWLTVKTQEDKYIKKNWKWLNILSYGAIFVCGQFLMIIGFYYLWLSLIILSLLFIINIIRNLKAFVQAFSAILFIIKGHASQIIPQLSGSLRESNIVENIKIFLSKHKSKFIIPLSLQDARNIVLGNDIIPILKQPVNSEKAISSFSVKAIYQSLLNLVDKQKNQ